MSARHGYGAGGSGAAHVDESASAQHPGAPSHQALFYRDLDEYRDGVLQFVGEGSAAGDPVVVAVPGPRLVFLRDSFAADPGVVEFFDMADLGRNPGRIIAAVSGFLERHSGRQLRFVSEPIWLGRSEEEIREATRHEALANVAWPDAAIRVLCPYDVAALNPGIVEDAERTHPHVIEGRRVRISQRFLQGEPPPSCADPLPAAPLDAATLSFDLSGLGAVRSLVAERAGLAQLSGDRVSDLVLAVHEVATNTAKHAHTSGLLRVWQADGRVICEVDGGGEIADPLAGRQAPEATALSGRGLWLANQLCDLVETRTGGSGTRTRLHIAVQTPNRP